MPRLFGNVGVYAAIPLAELCTLFVATAIFAMSRERFCGSARRRSGRAA